MRLIDADALIKAIKTECNPYGKPTIDFESGKKVLKIIDKAPTVELDESFIQSVLNKRCMTVVTNEYLVALHGKRPHSKWIEHYDSSDGFTWLTCSRCMYKAYEDDYNFCPNCGADMRKEAEND